jgi:tRNA-dihydrouridine synthase A
VTTLDQAREHLNQVDGVMMGRAAYQAPWVIAGVDAAIFGGAGPVATRSEALERFKPYVARELAKGAPLNAMTKHILGLYNGLPGARAFRRHLSENAVKRGAGVEVIDVAMALVEDKVVRHAAA